jgi:hypothetical protein
MPSRKTPLTRGQAKSTSPELDLIRTLADILNETGLSEIEYKGSRVRVSRTRRPRRWHHLALTPAPVAAPVVAKFRCRSCGTVKSPVGTIYMASAPRNQISGDRFEVKGQTPDY